MASYLTNWLGLTDPEASGSRSDKQSSLKSSNAISTVQSSTLVRHKAVVTVRELDINGDPYKEVREQSDQFTMDGEPLSKVEVLTRSIGKTVLQTSQTRSGANDTIVSAALNTTMSEEDLANFESSWSANWNPTLTEEDEETFGEHHLSRKEPTPSTSLSTSHTTFYPAGWASSPKGSGFSSNM